ncbi:hypothetical protein RvY_11340 [Ramazzottius varieornatus]|uniref:VWFA domain-containing protein n=1 Tax=Ramazzottius varieornatus TaxID=947166 RepID=A0A1D1VHV2_RAMVA|nr:hypothetical protein RvY_11340 [Ramazzottius varieornatus]
MLFFPMHYLLPTYLLLGGAEAGLAKESEGSPQELDHGQRSNRAATQEASSYQPQFGLPLAGPLPPTRSVLYNKISTINLPKEAKKIASVLRKISNVEIGLTIMQAVYDAAPFRTVDPDEAAILDSLVNKLQAKITDYENIARTTLRKATNASMFNALSAFSQSLPLCQYVNPTSHKSETINRLYGDEAVSIETPCLVIEGSLSKLSSATLDFIRVAAQDFVEQKRERTLTTKWQYAFSFEFTPAVAHGAQFAILEHPGHIAQNTMTRRWTAMEAHIRAQNDQKFSGHLSADEFEKKYKEYSAAKPIARFPHSFLANHIAQRVAPSATQALSQDFVLSEPWKSCHQDDCQALVSLSYAEVQAHAGPQARHHPTVVNMVGMDITIDELVEDFTYLQPDSLPPDSYAFLLLNNSNVLMHPKMNRQGSKFPPIDLLEPEFNATTFTSSVDSIRKYACKSIAESPLRACITWIKPKSGVQVAVYAVDSSPAPSSDLIYHRFDLYSFTAKQCLHQAQVSRSDACSLYLPAAVFNSPFQHVIRPETKSTVQGYLGFLNDKTQLLVNGQFKSGAITKAQVHLLHSICDEWLTRFHSSKIGPQILSRFAVTTSGVMVSFPPSRFDVNYDATEETWYQRTISQPGKIILTSPPIDDDKYDRTNSSPAIRFSHTIYQGKPNAMHSITDTVAAVLGLDLKANYLYQLLLDLVPDCRTKSLRCFLMDDSGYLIAHRKISGKNMETNPVEKYHITHLESVFAREFLNERYPIIQKEECLDVSAQHIQRLYSISASLDGVYSANRTTGLYSLIAVAGTNVYLVVLNAELVGNERAFCPCSLTDRNCLSCQKMEATACECPCQCAVGNQELKRQMGTDICPRRALEMEGRVAGQDEGMVGRNLPICWEFSCVGKTNKAECGKSWHCEWCTAGGMGRFKEDDFCSLKGKCYIFSQGDLAMPLWKAEAKTENSSAVGPVVALVATIFAVVTISLYCFCNHRREEVNNTHLLPADLSQIPVTFIDSEDDPTASLLGASATSVQAANGYINPANGDLDKEASPYAIGPGYRRPADYARGSNSADNGYSTMTGHDDSETQSSQAGYSQAQSRPRKGLLYRVEEGHVFVHDEVLVDVGDSGESDVASSVGKGSENCWKKLQMRRLPAQKQPSTKVCPDECNAGAAGSTLAGQKIVAYADVHAL